jgi:hypothetical protein
MNPTTNLGARALAFGLALVAANPALAEQQACPLHDAVYAEPEIGYSVAFRPVLAPRDPVGIVTASFTVTREGANWSLDGYVAGNMGVSRDIAHAYLDCPILEFGEIDFSEDCHIWTGHIYGLQDGTAIELRLEDAPAPQALLLVDFGRAIRYSDVGRGPADASWDVFTLTSCND